MSVAKHLEKLLPMFEERYGRRPAFVARAPGRVNLIGEHTDYNDGWVLPMAIPYEMNVAARSRDDRQVNLYAADLEKSASFILDDICKSDDPDDLWLNYPQGVASALQEAGYSLVGMDAVYSGDVPLGGGLSSSAALEVAFVGAFRATANVSDEALPPEDAAWIAHRAENDFVGVPTGIMDQFISALAEENSALLLDCRPRNAHRFEYRHIPINLPDTALVVINTGDSHELADANSEYRKRRETCDAAVKRLQSVLPGITKLRDITPELLEKHADRLNPVQRKRALHVVNENTRTLEAAAALEAGNAGEMGVLMYASHASLRDLYEVSSPALDAVVEIASGVSGVYGARMTGAGFGGAAVALVLEESIEALLTALSEQYLARTGREAETLICTPARGAEVIYL